jgi:hypothetical protein
MKQTECEFYPNFEQTVTKFTVQSNLGRGRFYENFKAIDMFRVVGRSFSGDPQPDGPLPQYLYLREEPENQADPNAIAVWCGKEEAGSIRIGYIAKDQTREVRSLIANPRTLFISSERHIFAVTLK